MTLSGCKDRGVESLITIPGADKKIKSLILQGIIPNAYNPLFAVNQEIFDIFEMNSSLLFNRYRGLDIIYQSNILGSFSNTMLNTVDLYDPRTMQDINNKYFIKYPLDLNVF